MICGGHQSVAAEKGVEGSHHVIIARVHAAEINKGEVESEEIFARSGSRGRRYLTRFIQTETDKKCRANEISA